MQYDNDPACGTGVGACTMKFTIATTMTAPVYFYYQLDNFYQNHRRYVKSRDFSQLKGTWPDDLSNCDPIVKNKDVSLTLKNVNKVLLNQEAPANPCGLVAKSFFTDKFVLYDNATPNKEVKMNEKGIAW
jgi:hypothetical protein